jgi:hypothetical protein
MKKFLLASLFVMGMVGVSHADFFGHGEDKLYTVHFSTSMLSATTSTTTILISLSSTTVWPHKDTGQISIRSVRVEIDKVAASTASVKLGLVYRINPSSSSIMWFFDKSGERNVSNTLVNEQYLLQQARINARANYDPTKDVGTVPYILSSDINADSTVYQSDIRAPDRGEHR